MDFGTTGARASVLDEAGNRVYEDRLAYRKVAGQTPYDWRELMHELLRNLPPYISSQLQRIAVDGTSSTVLLCDAELQPVSPALLYNDSRSQAQAEQLRQLAPAGHGACSVTSGLSKFLWLTQHIEADHASYFMHQVDWLSALLTGKGGTSDYHNALKSGYDVELLCWPEWIMKLDNSHLLPHVLTPGSLISEINPVVAQRFNINSACTIHAGTTDSIAAFIAANVFQAGGAVTSLGTTLVLKLLSETRVEAAQYGIYSHRFGDLWLAGGASNTGGVILRKYFSDEQLSNLSKQIDASTDSSLDYYPLQGSGERFPISDPLLQPRLTPRPDDDVEFLNGLLQGLSRIEAAGYAKLVELGATPLKSVSTCGGGANNPTWQEMRTRLLGVPVCKAIYTESSVGAALLAKHAGI